MKTYEIAKELLELQELIEKDTFDVNLETGEVTDNSAVLKALADEINLLKDEKADGIAYIIKEFKDAETNLQSEIKRLQERKAMMGRKQESLKQLLEYLLKGEKLKTNKFTFSYRTLQSVERIDESLIPAEFLNVVETIKPDKKKIKEALSEFNQVAGAKIVTNKSLSVR